MILSGIDYPYWATFNLQAVFPRLEDFLNGEQFPVSTVYNQVIRDWPTLRPTLEPLFSTPDLVTQFRTLYGAYLLAMARGAVPYELHPKTRPDFATADFMTKETGIARAVVVAFLSTLEKLAKSGGIDQRYWAPAKAVARNKAVTSTNEEYDSTKPPSQIGRYVQGLERAGVGLLVAAGVFGAYKVYRIAKG